MPRKRSPRQFPVNALELAWAAPQVIAHRTSRMALAGARPSARDRAEFQRMSSEKVGVFYQSWAAMWTAGLSAQLQLAHAISTAVSRAMGTILAAGLAPVHRKAVANAKRLSRRRR